MLVATTVLVRYGELALKSPPVRREFEHALGRNILEQFRRAGLDCRLRADHGHLYVTAEDGATALRLLRRIFGVTSLSPVVEVPAIPAEIERALLEGSGEALPPGASFAIRARRTGQHPFTSQMLARDLGGAVLARWPERQLTVDLDHPSVELTVEVRANRAYLYRERYTGPGGLPLGVAGRLVALVDGMRGALGAFLMMKRGCRVAILTEGDGEPLVRETLDRFDPRLSVGAARGAAERELLTLAESTRADGVVLPIPVEEYPAARAHWGDRVLFSPTVGFDDAEVAERWRAIVALAA